jgi:hypothetical protein
VTGLWSGRSGLNSRQGLGIFFFATPSTPPLGPTQPPVPWVPGTLSLGVERPGREADHSPPSSAEVKNAWNYNSTPQYTFMAWCLVKPGYEDVDWIHLTQNRIQWGDAVNTGSVKGLRISWVMEWLLIVSRKTDFMKTVWIITEGF